MVAKRGLVSVLASAAQSESIWHNRPIRLTDGAFWSSWIGGLSSSGRSVSVDRAMRLSAVWACVRLVSTSVAGLPLGLYKRLPDGSRTDARDHPVYDIIHFSPNDDMTPFTSWQTAVASMLLWGNAYFQIRRLGGRVVAIDFLLPSRVRLDADEYGRLIYFYTSKNGKEREIKREDMLHVPAFTLDGRVGLSAIRYGVDVFGAAISADDAANSTFKNGLMPTVAFSVDRVMKREQREEFREYIRTISGALNAGDSPVLEQGIKPESIGINPVDAQLLESRGWSIEEVSRWFGVPPWMIGHTDKGSNWGTGLEQQMIAYLTFCISSITNQIQQSINKRLLTAAERREYYAEFALEGFLKADSTTRSTFYTSALQNGWMTRNEVRRLENLSRVDGADILTVQTNLAPIDQLGRADDGQTARAALQNWLNDKPQE